MSDRIIKLALERVVVELESSCYIRRVFEKCYFFT